MSDLLGIGASGLRAYSRAMSTVGDNIANAQHRLCPAHGGFG